jgi:class 3 adenylate cyclase
MTVLDDSSRDLKRENAKLQRRLAERDSENAELQRRLAERESELAESVAQQGASSEVLQVINSSAGDLKPVFEAMLEKAIWLCEATFGHFRTYDGEGFPLAAVRGEPALVELHRQRFGHFVPGPHNPISRLVRGERLIHIPDTAADEAYRHDPGWPQLVAAGARSVLAVALRKDDALLGYINVYREVVGPFSDKQIALLQNFAAQAVIAMENARLLTETREALEQQTATAEVLGVINASPGELAPVFSAMLEKAMRLCEAAFGILWTYDGEYIHAAAHRGVPTAHADFILNGSHPGGQHPLTQLFLKGERFYFGNPALSENYRSGNPFSKAIVDMGGARSVLSVPLLKEGMLLGFIIVFWREVRTFDTKQTALLQNFAAQAVIAMENARLITETREALEQQTATAEVLGVINSSPGDLTPVFDAILEKAHSLCQAAHGHLTIYDGDLFRIVAMHGIDAVPPFLTEPFRPEPGSLQERLLRGERLIHILDIDIDASSPKNVRRQMAIEAGFHTVIFVPLRKDEVLVGYITAYRQEVRPFTDKQIALLENFAAQAVIAMENARLLGELRQRTEEVAELNRGLEARVADQVEELGRVGRLKRFLAPQLAELIVSQGDEKILESHRREIVVVFCDLRGYTAFTETAEPEEVLDFLREYHGALGPLVSQFEGTLDQFSGDGIMVFFNDPVPVPDPAERAVKMAMAMRETANRLITTWRQRDRELGFGVGIAQGYATLGQIGFADRSGYTAIGTVCNLAARLCGEAKDGQILVAGRVAAAVRETTALEDLGPVVLKGLTQPVSVFNVLENRNT